MIECNNKTIDFGVTAKTPGGGVKNTKVKEPKKNLFKANKTALFSRLLRQARDTEDLFYYSNPDQHGEKKLIVY